MTDKSQEAPNVAVRAQEKEIASEGNILKSMQDHLCLVTKLKKISQTVKSSSFGILAVFRHSAGEYPTR